MYTRYFLALAALAALGVLLAVQLAAFQPSPHPVSLDMGYATFKQIEFKPLDNTVDNDDLVQAAQEARRSPQQAVLCVGTDIAAAVKASVASFALADEPAPAIAATGSDVLWLAAYLGNDGSSPPAFQVRAVETIGTTVRVSYVYSEAPERTCDRLAYMIWIPLGSIAEGAYRLELQDADTGEVTLTRTWNVAVK